jgi:hypothetical protein
MYGVLYKTACDLEVTNEMAICNDYNRDVVATLTYDMDVATSGLSAGFNFFLTESCLKLYIYIVSVNQGTAVFFFAALILAFRCFTYNPTDPPKHIAGNSNPTT